MDFKELTVLNDKIKWMNQFTKSYEGGLGKFHIGFCKNTTSRFFVAIENGQHLGFVRITNHSNELEGLWSLSDAYVKPEFRGKGVLKALIKYVMKNCSVGKVYMTLRTYVENYEYYKSLGFTKFKTSGDGDLVYLYESKLAASLRGKNLLSLEDAVTLNLRRFISQIASNSNVFSLAA